ncbi:hypothetical protein [Mycobacterium sp. NAZ190054]|uniref:hypothetical protein n=1 Tax=Mycobacterium sp. NAZ190054 TaxID=1747766 RepID=UPI000B152898
MTYCDSSQSSLSRGGDMSPPAPGCPLPGLDEVEQECWQHFDDSASRIFDILQSRLLSEHNLTLFDVLLLKALARSPYGEARMGDLADALD